MNVLGNGLTVRLARQGADRVVLVIELESDHEPGASDVGDEVRGLGGGGEGVKGGEELGGARERMGGGGYSRGAKGEEVSRRERRQEGGWGGKGGYSPSTNISKDVLLGELKTKQRREEEVSKNERSIKTTTLVSRLTTSCTAIAAAHDTAFPA